MPLSGNIPLLTLQNVTSRYQDQVLLEEISFSVQKGEHWVLLGEADASKYHLLNTIAGKYNIVSGSIRHHYHETYVQENTPDDPYFTYHNLIALVSEKHHFRNLSNMQDFYYQQRYNSFDSEDAPTVESYLTAVQAVEEQDFGWNYGNITQTFKLEHLLEKELIKLSNGETKRLLLAAAVLKNPSLLLLINPLTGLDAAMRKELNHILSKITQSGITLIMTSSPDEIPDAITHVAVLENGVLTDSKPKSKYSPAKVASVRSAILDQAELPDLLSHSKTAEFQTLVEMKEVSVKYGDQVILKNINWHIRKGERWALLGHNGAGKSTLLSLITGDNPQSYANNLRLFDRQRGSGESIWDIKKNIGFVSPEFYQYFPTDCSCQEVVLSGFYDTPGLFRKARPEEKTTALRWMHLFGIDRIAEKYLHNVPQDLQRLCLLARALVKNPPLLILDEPCQGLNTKQKEHFRQLIEAICRNSNTSIIYVTHYRNEIPACVDNVLKLEHGKVVALQLA